MPSMGSAAYIVDLVFCFGFKTEWAELKAWSEIRGLKLHPFELKLIHVMSETYHAAYRKFDNTDSPRPYYDTTKKRDDSSIRRALRNNK